MDIKKIYFSIILMCIIEAIIYLLLFDVRGAYFYIGIQNTDPGGDFFLLIAASKNLDPYIYNDCASPPLTMLFLYFLSLFDRRGTVVNANIDTKNLLIAFREVFSQSFVYRNIFCILSGLLFIAMFYLIYYCFRKNEENEYKNVFYAMLLLANSGFLCGLVRGNVLIFSLLFLLGYVIFYDSNSKSLQTISLISLAIAFNIKPYVAIFGILLLYDRRYKDCIKLAVVSLFMFIIPFLFIRGGFLFNLKTYFINLLSFGTDGSFLMYGGKSIPILVIKILEKIFKITIDDKKVPLFFTILVTILVFIKGFLIKEKWKKILIATLIMILLSTNYGYIFSFMMVPILFFLLKEEKISIKNLLYMCSFLFLTAPFVITCKYFGTIRCILANSFILFLTFLIIFDGAKFNHQKKDAH